MRQWLYDSLPSTAKVGNWLGSVRDHFLAGGFNIYDVLLYTASYLYFPQHIAQRTDSLTALEESNDKYWLILIGTGTACTLISNQIIYRMRIGGYFSGINPVMPILSAAKLYFLYIMVLVSILFKANAASTSSYAKGRDIAHSFDPDDLIPLFVLFFCDAGNFLAQSVVQAEYLGIFAYRGFSSAKTAAKVSHFFIFFYSLSNTLLGINSINRNYALLYNTKNLISWDAENKPLAAGLLSLFVFAGIGMHLVYSQKSQLALTREVSYTESRSSMSKRALGFCAGGVRTWVMFTNAMGLLSKTPDQNGNFYLSESHAFWITGLCAPGLLVSNFSILFERKPVRFSDNAQGLLVNEGYRSLEDQSSGEYASGWLRLAAQ